MQIKCFNGMSVNRKMTFYLLVLIWVSVPVIVWFAIRSLLPKQLSVPLYAGIVAVMFYILIVVSASYQENKVESDLAEFDLAHSGMELTDSQQKERKQLFGKIIHDTARTFAPITGAIGAILYFILIWLTIFIVVRLKNLRSPRAVEKKQ